MKKNTVKATALAMLAGGAMYGIGCLGFGGGFNAGRILRDAAIYTGLEFVLDNDGVFDLFEDDGNNVAG